MDAQFAERVFFIAFRTDKGRRMIPVSGGLEFSRPRFFDEAAAVRFVHTDVGIHQVTGSVLKSLHSGLHCIQFVPVIAVDDTDDLSGRMADSLIHGIIDAVVRLAEDVITDPLCLKLRPVSFRNLHRVVAAGTVYDPIFDFV